MAEPIKISKPRGCQSLIVWDQGSHLELTLLTVRPASRGAGVGSEAIRRLQLFARQVGKAIRLTVDRPKRVSLSRFYANRGFRPAGGLEMVWP